MTLDDLINVVIGYQIDGGRVKGALEEMNPVVWARVRRYQVESMILRCWDETIAQVRKGRPVWFRGLGTFEVRVPRAGKTVGRHPRTRAPLMYQGFVRADMDKSPLDASEMMVCLYGREGWCSRGWQAIGKEAGPTMVEQVENAFAVYEAMIKGMHDIMAMGAILEIKGVGRFFICDRQQTWRRHPVTQEPVAVRSKRAPQFEPSPFGMPVGAKLDMRFNKIFLGVVN